jgi:hypothetical protein
MTFLIRNQCMLDRVYKNGNFHEMCTESSNSLTVYHEKEEKEKKDQDVSNNIL